MARKPQTHTRSDTEWKDVKQDAFLIRVYAQSCLRGKWLLFEKAERKRNKQECWQRQVLEYLNGVSSVNIINGAVWKASSMQNISFPQSDDFNNVCVYRQRGKHAYQKRFSRDGGNIVSCYRSGEIIALWTLKLNIFSCRYVHKPEKWAEA